MNVFLVPLPGVSSGQISAEPSESPGVRTGRGGGHSSQGSRAQGDLSARVFAVGIERAEEVGPNGTAKHETSQRGRGRRVGPDGKNLRGTRGPRL